MEFCALASGSSGNCIYVGAGGSKLLVDAGISCKKIAEGLASLGIDPDEIQGILITHDHCDHIQGAAVFARKYGVPVYATPLTMEYICKKAVSPPGPQLRRLVDPDEDFSVGEIHVRPFRISHDALDPVSYTVEADGQKIGFATDLGVYDGHTVEALSDCDALYIEANHDVNMLMLGSYSYSTKLRINSPLGHLSNEDCAALILRVRTEKLRHVVLGHISKENNLEELAYETVRQALCADKRFETETQLMVANRYDPSMLIRL
ncbi:MAG: MBL fold metallo-hydrolase [Lachnospiraceae bacterium]|nr:MBL fold metallo-hydrolase [Lachnospiraceae bacterium]